MILQRRFGGWRQEHEELQLSSSQDSGLRNVLETNPAFACCDVSEVQLRFDVQTEVRYLTEL